MSILNGPVTPPPPSPEQIAAQVRMQAKMTYDLLMNAFSRGASQFWQNPDATPAQIAAALGTDAAEAFALHGKLGAMLATISPEAVAKVHQMVGAFTVNEDGTVTVG